jgi:Cytidylate kinase-like family
MLIKGAMEKAKQYFESHRVDVEKGNFKNIMGPCITLSREAGAGAEILSQMLVDTFSKYDYDAKQPWAIFDQNLIEKVLQDNHLPLKLGEIMEERKYSAMTSILNELIAGQPGTWTLFHKTTETILQLAYMGYCIIVERGGNLITSKMDNCFHVRLIGSEEDKITHVMEIYNLDRREAVDYIKKEDENRKEYISHYFHKDVEDPLLYDFVINTSTMKHQEAAELITDFVIKKFPESFQYELVKRVI